MEFIFSVDFSISKDSCDKDLHLIYIKKHHFVLRAKYKFKIPIAAGQYLRRCFTFFYLKLIIYGVSEHVKRTKN